MMDETSFETALEELHGDRVRGASELARRCLQLLAASAREATADNADKLHRTLESRQRRLVACRPSMAPVQNLLDEWWRAVSPHGTGPLADLRSLAVAEAEQRIGRSRTALERVGQNAAAYVGTDKTIITHSLSSTVIEVFDRLKGSNVQALVSESRPLKEGRILARQLAEWQIPTQLITDAQLGLFVGQADVALVGADSLLPDGGLINKAGSLLLALAARERAVPFCVCCESYKRRRPGMDQPELEEMKGDELGAPPIPGVRIRNVYFDITPARLIDRWIDENGVHQAGEFSAC